MKRIFLPLLLLALALLIACTQDPQVEVVRVVETVEVSVPIEVTRIVERIIEIDANGTPVAVTEVAQQVPVTAEPSPIPTITPTPLPTGQAGEFDQDDLDKLFEIWEIVESEYYGSLPDDEALSDVIVSAAVDALGDDFTNYFPPDVARRINDGFRGDFTGIGAYVDTNDAGQFFIVRPIPNTPAFAAGLKPKDIVLEVDGTAVTGWSTDEVVAIVRGPAGESVTLLVARDGVAPFPVTIVRDRIVVPQIEQQLLADGRIGYVQLVSFNQVATDQLSDAIQNQLAGGAEAIIFDLRYNGGGLLTQAISVGDIFLKEGPFLIVRDNNGREDIYRTENGQFAEDIPLVVLINENSASASEIVAAAIQDQGRGKLVGVTTFGKGSVQTPYTLDDGSEFRVTTARFYSPADNEINGVGVSPDIEQDFDDEFFATEEDQTLQRAIEYLLEEVINR